MRTVDVDFEHLITFKGILDQNAIHFEEIRDNIGKTITSIIDTDWQDQKSEQFKEVYFGQSVPDIDALVNTMREFSAYLQKKIDILQQYHSTTINF